MTPLQGLWELIRNFPDHGTPRRRRGQSGRRWLRRDRGLDRLAELADRSVNDRGQKHDHRNDAAQETCN